MKEMTLILLTKSSKFSGYCVAGIDCESGNWVRLVTKDLQSHGAVKANNLNYENGRQCQILDVIRVPIINAVNDRLQPENVLLDTSKVICLVGNATMKDVLKIHPDEIRTFILGNKYSYITEAKVGELGYSLTLVKVNHLLIKHVSNLDGDPKTKADFTYQGERYENISVTDSRFYLAADERRYEEAYLVISIGTPYNGRYYKFVSAIYVENKGKRSF